MKTKRKKCQLPKPKRTQSHEQLADDRRFNERIKQHRLRDEIDELRKRAHGLDAFEKMLSSLDVDMQHELVDKLLLNLTIDKENDYTGVPKLLDGHSLALAEDYPYYEQFKEIERDRDRELRERIQNLADLVKSTDNSEDDRTAAVFLAASVLLEDRSSGLRAELLEGLVSKMLSETVNQWSSKNGTNVSIYRHNGRLRHVTYVDTPEVTAMERSRLSLETLGCRHAWSIKAETKALDKLFKLVSYAQFESYFLTGRFIMTSPGNPSRFYLLRRLLPVVFHGARSASANRSGMMTPMVALCLHPMGYYRRTNAGTLCPTDDVIAQYLMISGDEHTFWRKANQIPITQAEAGI